MQSQEELRLQNFFWFSDKIDALRPVQMPEGSVVCYRIDTDELEIWHNEEVYPHPPGTYWRVWLSLSETYVKPLLGSPESYGRIVLGEL